jgi:hypothetical protein
MCFSSKASFTAAAVLGAIAVASLIKAKKNPDRYLFAAMPLFFAIQQISEGMQWLYLESGVGTERAANAASELFLFIALVIWPFWTPLSVVVAERQREKRGLLYVFLVIGVLDTIYNAYVSLGNPMPASIVGHSIFYQLYVSQPSVWVYAIAVILPWFFTSTPKTKILGVGYALGYSVAAWFYFATFASVWCFFAAINSAIIYAIVTSEDR